MFFRKKKKRPNKFRIDDKAGRKECEEMRLFPDDVREDLHMSKICMAVLVPASAFLAFRFPLYRAALTAACTAALAAGVMAATRKFRRKMLPVPAVCIATGFAIGKAAEAILSAGELYG